MKKCGSQVCELDQLKLKEIYMTQSVGFVAAFVAADLVSFDD